MELTVFRETFGDSPFVRVLDFFMDNQVFDYSMADVRRDEGIAYNTIRPIWKKLIDDKFIIPTKKEGKAQLYKLNRNNEVVKYLIKLNFALCNVAIDKELKRQKIKH